MAEVSLAMLSQMSSTSWILSARDSSWWFTVCMFITLGYWMSLGFTRLRYRPASKQPEELK